MHTIQPRPAIRSQLRANQLSSRARQIQVATRQLRQCVRRAITNVGRYHSFQISSELLHTRALEHADHVADANVGKNTSVI